MEFEGAKVALFLGERLVVILRDDTPGLPFADHWDFPGGGREGDETPFECAKRECFEELGLALGRCDVVWAREFASAVTHHGKVWFLVARLPQEAARDVIFGNEGQCWALMEPDEFLFHPKAIAAFQARSRMYLAG